MSYFAKHLLFATFTISVGLFFFISAQSMPSAASLFPQIISILIFILSALMVYSSTKAVPGTKKAPVNVKRVVIYAALIAVYIAATDYVGYFITTPLFMIVSYLYLKATGFFKAFLISAAFSFFIYLLFVIFLNLPVPLGLLEPLLGA